MRLTPRSAKPYTWRGSATYARLGTDGKAGVRVTSIGSDVKVIVGRSAVKPVPDHPVKIGAGKTGTIELRSIPMLGNEFGAII